MEKVQLTGQACPMARALGVVGEWWSLLIVREAFGGVTRFNDFQRRLGISRNALTARLDKLVTSGVFERRPVAEDGLRQEYVLSTMGEDLLPLVVALRQWGDRWLFPDTGPPAKMVERSSGTEIAALVVRSKDGRPLSRSEIGLQPLR